MENKDEAKGDRDVGRRCRTLDHGILEFQSLGIVENINIFKEERRKA